VDLWIKRVKILESTGRQDEGEVAGEAVQDTIGCGHAGAGRDAGGDVAASKAGDSAGRGRRGQDDAGEYDGPKVHLFHLDLYRLETEEQIAVLGLEEMIAEPNALVLVEWGERFESVVKLADAEIAMEHGEGDERGLIVRWRE